MEAMLGNRGKGQKFGCLLRRTRSRGLALTIKGRDV